MSNKAVGLPEFVYVQRSDDAGDSEPSEAHWLMASDTSQGAIESSSNVGNHPVGIYKLVEVCRLNSETVVTKKPFVKPKASKKKSK